MKATVIGLVVLVATAAHGRVIRNPEWIECHSEAFAITNPERGPLGELFCEVTFTPRGNRSMVRATSEAWVSTYYPTGTGWCLVVERNEDGCPE